MIVIYLNFFTTGAKRLFCQESSPEDGVQRVMVDFNLDGVEDIVEGHHSDSTFTAFFISTDKSGKKDTVSISIKLGESMNQNAFCGEKITIEVEKLDYDPVDIFGEEFSGFIQSDEHYGVRLSDGICDSFHFFWNHDLKKIQYWRR
jgi:hypothetical protein